MCFDIARQVEAQFNGGSDARFDDDRSHSKAMLIQSIPCAPDFDILLPMGFQATRVLAAATLLLASRSALIAQSTDGAKPAARFEVASVKPHTSDDRRDMLVALPGGRFVALNTPLRHIIRTAFQLQDDQIVGGPDWIDTDRFDIEAQAANMPGAPGIELLEMLQSLLADRFGLKTHRDMREVRVFALERASRGGALGAEMRPTECPDPVIDLSRPKPCANISAGYGLLRLRGMPIAQFAQYLAPHVSRVVVDRTGLDGRYDIDLKWLPDQTQGAGTPAPSVSTQDRVSIFTALQEQLGLKLESTTASVEVLVIDAIAHPTPN
jgi:uncharacterized protein (TIGR03435 family)